MKRINWEVAKEKAKGNLDAVGNSAVAQKFMAIGQKIVYTMRRRK